MNSVVVRPAVPADAARLVKLRRKLFAETQFMLLDPSEFRSTAKDEAQRIRLFDAKANALILVAQDGEVLVGTLVASSNELLRLAHSAVLALGIGQSHWGKGIGSRMIAEAVAWSRQNGIRRLELTVHTTNLRAIAVYLRAGFQVEGLRRASLVIDGRYVDEYLMAIIEDG
ncbi:GNAT family N-acetyltransferase [Variovorax paradoxus]|nr:GNAT family N-acetyltransferase [Variovorax paradoxus]